MRKIAAWFLIGTFLLAACRPALPTAAPFAITPTRAPSSPAPVETVSPSDPSPVPTPVQSPTPRAAETINQKNAGLLGMAAKLGYGTLLGAVYLSDGDLLVSTHTGVYRFAADLSNPRKVSESPLRDLTTAAQGVSAAGTSLTTDEVILLPLINGAKEQRISFSSDLFGVRYAITPDGSQLMMISSTYLFLFDARSGKQLRAHLNQEVCGQVQANFDGKSLVCYTNNLTGQNTLDYMITVIDLQSGKSLARYKPNGLYSQTFSLAQDGRMAINNQTLVDIYPNASASQPVEALSTGQYYSRVDISPDGALLAGSLGDRIDIWDIKAKKLLHSLSSMLGIPAFSPDSRNLMVWNAGGLALYSVADLSLTASLPGSSSNPLLLFTPDSSRFIELTGSMLQSWETASYQLIQSMPIGSGQQTAAAYFLNTDQTHPFYDAFKDYPALLIANERSNNLTLYDPVQHKRLQSILDFDGFSSALTFSSDNELALFGQPGGAVSIFNLRTGEPVSFTGSHAGRILALALSPDKRSLLTVGADEKAILWEISTSQAVKTVDLQSTESGFAAASLAGNLFLVGDPKSVHLFSSQPGGQEQGIPCRQCLAAAFSPDGNLLAAADGNQISIYDVADLRQPLVTLSGRQEKPWLVESTAGGQSILSDAVVRLVFSPDGKWLASGSSSGLVTLWSTAPDATLTAAVLPTPDPAGTSGAERVENIQPFGSSLPVGKESISRQNLERLTYLGRWGERGVINEVIYAPDGKSLLVSTSLALYRIDPASLEIVQTFDRPGFYYNTSVQSDGRVIARDNQANLFIFNADGSFAEPAGRVNGVIAPSLQVTARVSGQQVSIVPVRGGKSQTVTTSLKNPQITLSYGGELMVLVSDSTGELEVWDLNRAAALIQYKIDKRLSRAILSPDASLLAVLSQSNTAANNDLLVWKIGAGSQPEEFPLGFPVSAIAVSQDNQYIAVNVNSRSGGVKILNRSDGSLAQSLETPYTSLLRFSPDGKSILLVTSTSIEMYDLATGKLNRTAGGFSTPASDFQTILGTPLVAVRVMNSCVVYDTAQTKILIEKEYSTCLVTTDGKKLVVNSNRGFLVYLLPDLSEPEIIQADNYYLKMRVSDDGALLAGLTPYYQWKGVTIYDLASGQAVSKLDLPNMAWDQFDFSQDGSLLAGTHAPVPL